MAQLHGLVGNERRGKGLARIATLTLQITSPDLSLPHLLIPSTITNQADSERRRGLIPVKV